MGSLPSTSDGKGKATSLKLGKKSVCTEEKYKPLSPGGRKGQPFFRAQPPSRPKRRVPPLVWGKGRFIGVRPEKRGGRKKGLLDFLRPNRGEDEIKTGHRSGRKTDPREKGAVTQRQGWGYQVAVKDNRKRGSSDRFRPAKKGGWVFKTLKTVGP